EDGNADRSAGQRHGQDLARHRKSAGERRRRRGNHRMSEADVADALPPRFGGRVRVGGSQRVTAKRWLQLLLSLVISAAFIWYAVRGIDLAMVGRIIVDADYFWAIPALILLIAIQFIRIWRFSYLVAPMAKVPFRSLFHIGNIGMLAVFALPVRLGEFVRP